MRVKTKLAITISSVVLVAIASVIAIVSVLAAATSTTISSNNIKITYTVAEVITDVEAYYKVGSDNNITTSNGTQLGSTLSLNSTTTTGTINVGDENYTLSRTDDSIVFLYVFNNKANEYTATCTFTAINVENFKMFITVGNGTETQITSIVNVDLPYLTVNEGTTATPTEAIYKIRFEIDNPDANASLECGFAWNLAADATAA